MRGPGRVSEDMVAGCSITSYICNVYACIEFIVADRGPRMQKSTRADSLKERARTNGSPSFSPSSAEQREIMTTGNQPLTNSAGTFAPVESEVAKPNTSVVSSTTANTKSTSDTATSASSPSPNLSPTGSTLLAEVSEREEPAGKRQRKATMRNFAVDTRPSKRKKATKKKKGTEEEFDMAWICCECKEAECAMQPNAEELLICEGLCRRLFHYPCANLPALPAEEESFVCMDCTQQRHCCAYCQEYGADQVDVFKCNRNDCGLFFHEHCLAMEGIDMQEIANVGDGVNDGTDEAPTSKKANQRSFVCPAHECWTCYQPHELRKLAKRSKAELSKLKKSFMSKKSKTSRLMRCIECPRSFHIDCIPPTANFHELALLCHEHASTHKLPDLDMDCSMQGELERKIEEKYTNAEEGPGRQRRRPQGNNEFIPALEGSDLSDRELAILDGINKVDGQETMKPSDFYFCLPCDIKNEVHSKPPAYHHVHSNRYDPSNRPPRAPRQGDTCNCIDKCDENCMNRVLYIECCGNPTAQGGRYNCNVGLECGNRQLGRRQTKKCKIQREQGKGWGLVAAESVQKGELVLEYTGEVIDSQAKELRLADWSREHPNDPNFYIMALKGPWYIDARFEGNFARFINHSCGPNCVLFCYEVDGMYRNGIFALRDIAPGEYLSYDYHFDTQHGDRFVCHCGSVNCRGTMKGGKTTETAAKSMTWEHAKESHDRDVKFVQEYYRSLEERSNLVSAALPGSASDEWVASGPPGLYKGRVRESRIFLWRNAVLGSDFDRRFRKHSRK